MSERQKVIEELLMLKKTVKMDSDADLALNYAIDSLKTDEAYCLIYEKPELCEDCISRQKIIDSFNRIIKDGIPEANGKHVINIETILNTVINMPSVIPKFKSINDDKWQEVEKELIQLSKDNENVEAYNTFNAGVQYAVGYAIGTIWRYFDRQQEEKE